MEAMPKVVRRGLAAGSLIAVLAGCTGTSEAIPPPSVASTTSSPKMGPQLPDILLTCQSDGKMNAIPPELADNTALMAERLGVFEEAIKRGMLVSAQCEQGVKPADIEQTRAKAVIKGLGGLGSPCLVVGVVKKNVDPSAPPLLNVPRDKEFHDILAVCPALLNGAPTSSEVPSPPAPTGPIPGTDVDPRS